MNATDRADILEASFIALANGIESFEITTGVSAQDHSRHHLLIDLALADGPTSRFADLLFHGTPEALEKNGRLFIYGGLKYLSEGIMSFREAAWSARHHRRKLDRMRGRRR